MLDEDGTGEEQHYYSTVHDFDYIVKKFGAKDVISDLNVDTLLSLWEWFEHASQCGRKGAGVGSSCVLK